MEIDIEKGTHKKINKFFYYIDYAIVNRESVLTLLDKLNKNKYSMQSSSKKELGSHMMRLDDFYRMSFYSNRLKHKETRGRYSVHFIFKDRFSMVYLDVKFKNVHLINDDDNNDDDKYEKVFVIDW